MKMWLTLSKSGPAAAAWLAGICVLGGGCAEERVVYVPQVNAGPVAVAEAPPIEVAAPAPAPPPAPVVTLRSAAELDTMLAPIALYPDPLLAQVLPAATLPAQVVLADRYVRGGGDLNQVDAQPWDNSLKALARYPAVLQMLDDNLAWTSDLGQAFINQPADVMDSVQRLRAQARAIGNLVSTAQQVVVVDPDGAIEIVPATPELLYVPVYQPALVYVQAPPPGEFYVSFGAGLMVGAWLNHDCDWHQHTVIVWHRDHPRPVNWWYHPGDRRPGPPGATPTTAGNNRAADFTVWHPRTRGTSGDRGWGQTKVQVPAAGAARARPSSPASPPRAAPPSSPTKRPEPVKTPAPGKAPAPRPSPPANAPRPGPAKAPPAPGASSRAGAPSATPHPVMNAPSRAAAAPPKGVESSRATRDASSRGQQSRESISRPAPAPRPVESSPPSPSSGGTRRGR